MKKKIEELIEVLDVLEKLIIKLISVAGWIAILVYITKQIFN